MTREDDDRFLGRKLREAIAKSAADGYCRVLDVVLDVGGGKLVGATVRIDLDADQGR